MSNQASEDELRKKIDVILAANMPIHPEHQIDKRNIINNLIPIIRTEKLNLLAEVRERVVGEDKKPSGSMTGLITIDTARNELKAEMRETLTKLEAEL